MAAPLLLPAAESVATSTATSECLSTFSEADCPPSSVTSVSEVELEDKNNVVLENPVDREEAGKLPGSSPFLNLEKPYETGTASDCPLLPHAESQVGSAISPAGPSEESLELGLYHPAAKPHDEYLSQIEQVLNNENNNNDDHGNQHHNDEADQDHDGNNTRNFPARSSCTTEENNVASVPRPTDSARLRHYHGRPGRQMRKRSIFCNVMHYLSIFGLLIYACLLVAHVFPLHVTRQVWSTRLRVVLSADKVRVDCAIKRSYVKEYLPLPVLSLIVLTAVNVWYLWDAWEQCCAEKRVLSLNINGKPASAWPDTAGVNAMSLQMARNLGLKVDSTKRRRLRTAVLETFETLGEVTAPVSFSQDASKSQEVVFNVLEDRQWLPCLPVVTIGSVFLYKNQLLDPNDKRYHLFTIRGLLALLVWQEQGRGTMQHFCKVELQQARCKPAINALLDTGSTFDAMSHAYAAENFPEQGWPRQASLPIRCSDGSETPSSGNINVVFRVGDRCIQRTFVIVKDLARDIILGHEFWVRYSPFLAFKDHIDTEAPASEDPIDHWPQDVNAMNRGMLRIGRWISSKWKREMEIPSMCYIFKISDHILTARFLESTLLRMQLEEMDEESVRNQIWRDRRELVVGKYRAALEKEGKLPKPAADDADGAESNQEFEARPAIDRTAEPEAHETKARVTEKGGQKCETEPAVQHAAEARAESDERQRVVMQEQEGPPLNNVPVQSSTKPAESTLTENSSSMSRSTARHELDSPATTPESITAQIDSAEDGPEDDATAFLAAFPSVPTGDPENVAEPVRVDINNFKERIVAEQTESESR
jgi:hypothetical protein